MLCSDAWFVPLFSLLRLCVVEALSKIDSILIVMLFRLKLLKLPAVINDLFDCSSDWAFLAGGFRLIVQSKSIPKERTDPTFCHRSLGSSLHTGHKSSKRQANGQGRRPDSEQIQFGCRHRISVRSGLNTATTPATGAAHGSSSITACRSKVSQPCSSTAAGGQGMRR